MPSRIIWKVPRAPTFGSPVGVGKIQYTHSIVVYHGNQQPGADKRGVVDDYLRATRGLPSTDTEWSTGFGKVAPGEDVPAQGLKSRDARSVGQDDQFVTAMQFRQVPTVPFKDGRVDTGAAASMQQTLQQQADNYSKLPNAKPDYAAALQKKADAFAGVTKDAVATAAQSDSQRIAATAPAEAAAAGSKTTAEQSAMEPFKQKERQFQAGLTLNTDAAKSANEQNQKYWADPQHGYLQANSNFNMVDHAIDQASDGNGLATSFIPAMEALGVSVAQGSHRVAPADAAAAGAPGGWAERFNAWVDKSSQGKTSPQLVQEGHTLINDLRQSAYNKALGQAQMAATSGKISVSPNACIESRGKNHNARQSDHAYGSGCPRPRKKWPDVLGKFEDPRNHWARGVNDASNGNRAARFRFRLEQGSPSDGSFGRTAAVASGTQTAPGATDTEYDWSAAKSPTSSARITPSTGTAILPRARGIDFLRPLKKALASPHRRTPRSTSSTL